MQPAMLHATLTVSGFATVVVIIMPGGTITVCVAREKAFVNVTVSVHVPGTAHSATPAGVHMVLVPVLSMVITASVGAAPNVATTMGAVLVHVAPHIELSGMP